MQRQKAHPRYWYPTCVVAVVEVYYFIYIYIYIIYNYRGSPRPASVVPAQRGDHICGVCCFLLGERLYLPIEPFTTTTVVLSKIMLSPMVVWTLCISSCSINVIGVLHFFMFSNPLMKYCFFVMSHMEHFGTNSCKEHLSEFAFSRRGCCTYWKYHPDDPWEAFCFADPRAA